MNTSTERRHFWRAPFHSPARLVRTDGSVHVGQVHDVSLKGALFEVDAGGDCRLDERCHLQVDLSEDTPIRMQATVVHVEGRNVGLRCDEIDLDSITALRRVADLNAADPDLLEPDLGALVRQG